MKEQIVNNIEQNVVLAIYAENIGETKIAFQQYGLILEAINVLSSEYVVECADLINRMNSVERTPEAYHRFAGLVLEQKGYLDEASEEYHRAVTLNPLEPIYRFCFVKMLIKNRKFSEAREILADLAATPGCADMVIDVLSNCDAVESMPGDDYYSVLKKLHEHLQPKTYLEIGLGHGKSLALAGDNTVALGVDPLMADWERLFFCRENPSPKLYKETSDNFFRRYDLRHEMEHDVCDMAFIDGFHLFEQVLMDFAHVEQYCAAHSVIMLHDCLPVNPQIANRNNTTGFWTGDVWKVIPCLKTVRPDLNIVTIPAYPSGLAIITNLDPASRVLGRHFDEIVRHHIDLELPESKEERYAMMNCSNDCNGISSILASR